MPETRHTTPDDIIQADEERYHQAMWLALAESGPYPGDHSPIREMYKWRRRVNKLAREIAGRLN
jgi:hypothetical protein